MDLALEIRALTDAVAWHLEHVRLALLRFCGTLLSDLTDQRAGKVLCWLGLAWVLAL